MWGPVGAPRVVVMVAPVPMRIPVGAPRVVSPIVVSVRMVAVVPPAHYRDRRGSDHAWRRDAKADGDIDAGLGGLGAREQCESQEGDHTTHAYAMCETFHGHILTVQHRLLQRHVEIV